MRSFLLVASTSSTSHSFGGHFSREARYDRLNVYGSPLTKCGTLKNPGEGEGDYCTYREWDRGKHQICVPAVPPTIFQIKGDSRILGDSELLLDSSGLHRTQFQSKPWCISASSYIKHFLAHGDTELTVDCSATASEVLQLQTYDAAKGQTQALKWQKDAKTLVAMRYFCHMCYLQATCESAKQQVRQKCESVWASKRVKTVLQWPTSKAEADYILRGGELLNEDYDDLDELQYEDITERFTLPQHVAAATVAKELDVPKPRANYRELLWTKKPKKRTFRSGRVPAFGPDGGLKIRGGKGFKDKLTGMAAKPASRDNCILRVALIGLLVGSGITLSFRRAAFSTLRFRQVK